MCRPCADWRERRNPAYRAIEAIAHTIPEEQRIIRRYADGYHLLLRDLQRDDVVSDIVAFINDLDGYDRRCQKTVQKIPPENALE